MAAAKQRDGASRVCSTWSLSLMVVSYARPGMSTGILRGDTYTPIPWDPDTATAAW
jgi:hypothetical protein